MLEHPSWRTSIDELKKVLHLLWDKLPQDSINSHAELPEKLGACVNACSGHF